MHEVPVSYSQQRLWLLDRLEPGSPAHNVVRVFRLGGQFDRDALGRAWQAVILRHEALRTSFAERDGIPVQLIHDELDIPVRYEDFRHVPAAERDEIALARACEDARSPFDLEAGPLCRLLLIRTDAAEHIAVITMHHIVTDGWSMGLLFSELAELYDAAVHQRAPRLPELPLGYGEFAAWQRAHTPERNDAARESLAYWVRTLDGAPAVLDVPTDRPRPASQGPEGRTVRFCIDAGTIARLKTLADRNRATLFMALLAAWQVLLARYAGTDDVVVSSPVAGRPQLELERVIGFFVNTVPLRTSLAGNPTFEDLLARVRNACLDAWAHADVPFDRIVEALNPERSLSHAPVAQSMFILQNLPRRQLRLGALDAEEIDFDAGVARADLTFEAVADGRHCAIEYRAELFDERRVQRMAEHFQVLLDQFVADPTAPIAQLEIVTPRERGAIERSNRTTRDYPRDASIAALFRDQASRTPDNIALIAAERQVTYAALSARADGIARRLSDLGIGVGERVAVCVERSVDAIASVLGVLNIGAVFVPIDPSYPEARIAFMLSDSRAAAVVAHAGTRGVPSGVPLLDPSENPIDGFRQAAAPRGGDVAAYLMYTSGSTGIPKGVVGTHRGLVNRLSWMWREYPFAPGEVCVQKTALSFVDSVAETFLGLLRGVPTVVLADDVARDPARLARAIQGHGVTRLVLVPSLLRSLLAHVADAAGRLATLRICVTSGEELPIDLFDRFRAALPHVRLLNLYGSSEVAADATCFDAFRDPVGVLVPIGRPIDNTRVRVLDPNGRLTPIGVPGEICVSGDGVALGYHERPELTPSRFGSDPDGARTFRTGDRGRLRDDGQLEYLGRTDHQVKLRGMRIELGEIESTLARLESVRQSLVVLDRAASGPRLVAYVVPQPGAVLVPAELRAQLRRELLEHMVPAVFVALPELPVTPNGKIDRGRLPTPDAVAPESAPHEPPAGDIEMALARIWMEVLSVPPMGRHDGFFDLGGHSLLGVQVLARVRHEFDAEVPLRALFDDPTVAGLARAVEAARAAGHRARTPRIEPLRRPSDRAALLAQLQALSDEEVDRLLQAALARRGESAAT